MRITDDHGKSLRKPEGAITRTARIEMDFLFGDYWSSRNTFSDYQMWFLAI